MSKIEKLMEDIRNNPKNVRFKEACKAAVKLGFTHKGGKGSHRAFGREDEICILNFQNRGGYIKPYQAKQLIDMIEKYEKK